MNIIVNSCKNVKIFNKKLGKFIFVNIKKKINFLVVIEIKKLLILIFVLKRRVCFFLKGKYESLWKINLFF